MPKFKVGDLITVDLIKLALVEYQVEPGAYGSQTACIKAIADGWVDFPNPLLIEYVDNTHYAFSPKDLAYAHHKGGWEIDRLDQAAALYKPKRKIFA